MQASRHDARQAVLCWISWAVDRGAPAGHNLAITTDVVFVGGMPA